MGLVDARTYFQCSFCACIAFPDDSIASGDGVVALNSETNRFCPACRVPLVEGTMDETRVRTCPRCRGILLTNEEFLLLMGQRRARSEKPPRKPRPIDPADFNRRIDCPSCDRAMEAHPYYGPGNVVIDSCSRCRVLWLDHREFATIETAPSPNW